MAKVAKGAVGMEVVTTVASVAVMMARAVATVVRMAKGAVVAAKVVKMGAMQGVGGARWARL